ncbi:MAG: hypothetical protein HKP30_16775, partial [Myxococcales bacterium]|nr:hypothetical protein [Myxococcales bacterium]
VWREHYLAVEGEDEVRGGYALKPHEWTVRGESHLVTDWQGPITEAVVNRRYNTLGIRLLREMLKQYPLLYSWGHGGLEQPMLEMLRSLGWLLHGTPFCLRVLKPVRFLRRNRYLRTTAARKLALDALAWSGAGSLGLRALHAGLGIGKQRSAPAEVEIVPRFEAWADALFERCKGAYVAIGARDADTMNALVPEGERWPPGIRLRVRRDGETIGWAIVLDTSMEDDRRFGTCRVGSVVDCLAHPDDAEAVVGAAFRHLRERGVDLVISNQSHPAWLAGFAAHGFHLVPERRVFAASPALRELLSPVEESLAGLHLTNMDGHGPMRL